MHPITGTRAEYVGIGRETGKSFSSQIKAICEHVEKSERKKRTKTFRSAEKTHRGIEGRRKKESSREKRLKNVPSDVNEAAISQTLNNYVINSSFTLFNPFWRFTEKKSCLRDSTVKRCRRFMVSSPHSCSALFVFFFSVASLWFINVY